MRNILFAAAAIASLIGPAAMADEFSGQAQPGATAQLDQQATASQLADPTAAGSLRSHGHP